MRTAVRRVSVPSLCRVSVTFTRTHWARAGLDFVGHTFSGQDPDERFVLSSWDYDSLCIDIIGRYDWGTIFKGTYIQVECSSDKLPDNISSSMLLGKAVSALRIRRPDPPRICPRAAVKGRSSDQSVVCIGGAPWVFTHTHFGSQSEA